MRCLERFGSPTKAPQRAVHRVLCIAIAVALLQGLAGNATAQVVSLYRVDTIDKLPLNSGEERSCAIDAALFHSPPLDALCDVNRDGVVDCVDARLVFRLAYGACFGGGQDEHACNPQAWKMALNEVLTEFCGGHGSDHMVAVSWQSSVSPNVVGYNVYRGVTSGGPYQRLNSTAVSDVTFSDFAVEGGQTYYYVATAVDESYQESVFSNEAEAAVPFP